MSKIAPCDPNESLFCEECGVQVKFSEYRLHCRTAHKKFRQKDPKQDSASKKKEFICHICNKSHTSRYNLNYHLAHHYNLKEFRCDLCSNAYNTQSDLMQHKRSHGGGKNRGSFFCRDCDEFFEIQYKYEAHMSKHQAKNSKPNKSNECLVCHKFFQSSGFLEMHMRAHERKANVKRFECDECQKTFKAKATLMAHIDVIHKGVKKFSCVVCGNMFGNSRDRRRHELIHERGSSNVFWCSICKKSIRSNILAHDQKFHPELQFTCDICARRFATTETLKRHHLVKHSKLKFICDLCGISVTTIHAIRQHILLHIMKKTCLPDELGNFACHICGIKSPRLRVIARHIVNIHESDATLECEICEKKFRDPSYLVRHKKTHSKNEKIRSENLQIQCDFCDILFKSKKILKQHKQNAHSNLIEKKNDGKVKNSVQKNQLENNQNVIIKVESIEDDEISIFESQIKAEPMEFHDFKQEASDGEEVDSNEQLQKNELEISKNLVRNDDGFESDWMNNYENEDNDSDWSETKNEDFKYFKDFKSTRHKKKSSQTSEKFPPEKNGKKLHITCRICCLTFTAVKDYEEHFMESHEDIENYLQCKDCIITFESLENLQQHFIKHHSIFKCTEKCRREFSSQISLDEHQKDHKKWNNIPCSLCDELIEGRHALLAHHEAKHADKQLKCDMCNKSYAHRSYLMQHQRKSHTGIAKKLKCLDCNFEANKKEIIKRHFNMEHNFKIIQRSENQFCYICKIFVNNAMDLNRHTYKEHDGLIFSVKQKCSLCREPVGKAMYNAIIHMALVHDNGKQKLRKCGYCRVEIELFEEYAEHIASHPGVFICATCGEPFYTEIALKNHSEDHRKREKELQLYECDFCGTKKRNLNKMEIHILSQHAKFPPLHTCEFCGKGFKILSTLYAHRKFMHIGGSKACTFCDRKFVNNHDLTVHIRTHTGEKPFVCEVCNLRFSSKQTLKEHHQRHSQTRTNYECETCNISFGRNKKGLIEHHGKFHPEKRPFLCRFCSRSFISEHRCRVHEETHGSDFSTINVKNCEFK